MISGEFLGDRIRITVPEAEFVIRLRRDSVGSLRISAKAVFRGTQEAGGARCEVWQIRPDDPAAEAVAATLIRRIAENRSGPGPLRRGNRPDGQPAEKAWRHSR